jgi:hypothetical protein
VIMAEGQLYTTQLQAGLGLIDETKELLDLWSVGMTASQLHQLALTSGRFPNVTARRLRNIVSECFAPRYLVSNGAPAQCLKLLSGRIPAADLAQIMLIYTARANPILGDFIRTVFWPRYAGGYAEITNDVARAFVERAIDDGKTSMRWSESTVRRISAYVTGCCADYGLLSGGPRSARRIHPLRISSVSSAYLAYDLHLAGVGDNALLSHPDWQLFGLAKDDTLDELKRLSLKGHLIVQVAGDVVRVSWKQSNMQELCDVLTQG